MIHVLRLEGFAWCFGPPLKTRQLRVLNGETDKPGWTPTLTLFFPSHTNSSKWFNLSEAELLIWKVGIIITSSDDWRLSERKIY